MTDTAPTYTNGLNTRALLISYTVHSFHVRRASRNMLASANATHYVADSDMYLQALLPPDQLRGIANAITALRRYVNSVTVPWASGLRMLPTSDLFDFRFEFGELEAEYMRQVELVADKYMELKEYERERRGDMFIEEAYPETAKDFYNHHSIDLLLLPVPDTDDFRITVPEDVAVEIAKDTDDKLRKLVGVSREAALVKLRAAVAAHIKNPHGVVPYRVMDRIATEALQFNVLLDLGIGAVCSEIGGLNSRHVKDASYTVSPILVAFAQTK